MTEEARQFPGKSSLRGRRRWDGRGSGMVSSSAKGRPRTSRCSAADSALGHGVRGTDDAARLAERVALVGLSGGGLYCYNWASANPDKVACLYGDAPVCGFKSWPGAVEHVNVSGASDRLIACLSRFRSTTLGAGSDQMVLGWRAMNDPGVPGIKLFTPLDATGAKRRETRLSKEQVAVEDIKTADPTSSPQDDRRTTW